MINFDGTGQILGPAPAQGTIQPTTVSFPDGHCLMRPASLVERIRLLVQRTLQELQLPVQDLEETILIRNGFYCGRRYQAVSSHAIWFCEENQLKFYGEQGTLLHVIANVDHQIAQSPDQPLADAA